MTIDPIARVLSGPVQGMSRNRPLRHYQPQGHARRETFRGVRRRLQAIPANNDSAGLLVVVNAHQKVYETEDSARTLAAAAANRFGNAWHEPWARTLTVVAHLPRTFDWLQLGLDHAPRQASRRSSNMSIAEVSRDLVRGVRLGHVPPPYHWVSLSEPCRPPLTSRPRRRRSRVHLAMNSGSGRFISLFERSAPWRPVQ